jgi:hypothetical protein
MQHPTLQIVVALLAGMAAASCFDASSHQTSLEAPAGIVAARINVDTLPRANLVWADSVIVNGVTVAAGIRGDGRLKNGAPSTGSPSNEYQGAWCGVGAFARDGTDLNFTPNVNWTTSMQPACGSQRLYNFYMNGPNGAPTASGPHSFAFGLWTLAIGQSATPTEAFGVQLPGCDLLMFSDSARYAPANSPRQTRLQDVVVNGVTQRQWRIETQGSHQAACVVYNRNGTVKSVGPWYFLPFSLTVTEVKYPWSSYP